MINGKMYMNQGRHVHCIDVAVYSIIKEIFDNISIIILAVDDLFLKWLK